MIQSDDTATSPRSGTLSHDPAFAVVRRGYERSAVDEQMHQYREQIEELTKEREKLHGETTLASERIVELESQVSELERHSSANEATPYGGAGDKIAGMLRAAEKQAAEILAKAGRDADQRRRQADEEVAQLRRAAQDDVEALLSEQCAEIERLRAEAIADADSYRQGVRAEANDVIEDAHAEAEQLRAAAEQELEALRAKARSEAAEIRAAADREVAETRSILAQEKERLSQEVRREHESSLRNAEILWSEVTSRLAERARRIEEATERSVGARKGIEDEAQGILARAQNHADQAYIGAQKRAEYAESRGRNEAHRILEAAHTEAGAIKDLRAGIAAKLSELQQELRELGDEHTDVDAGAPEPSAAVPEADDT